METCSWTAPQMPTCLSLYRGPCHPMLTALRSQSSAHTSRAMQRLSTVKCTARATKKRKKEEDDLDPEEYELRPWTFFIPSIHEIVADPQGWPDRVKDWPMFWGMVNNWVHTFYSFNCEIDGKGGGFVSPDQAEWMQLYLDRDVGTLEQAIDLVVERIPELELRGVPITDKVPGKNWSMGKIEQIFGYDEKGRRYHMLGEERSLRPLYERPRWRKEQEPEAPPLPQRVWDDWQEGDLRAYEEKQRRHRRQLADFAQRQAELGKFQYLDVSPLTDPRYRIVSDYTAPHFVPREYSHEEIMQVVTKQGTAVDPETVRIRIQDPEEPADYFQEGVHWVPDTMEYIRSTGHLMMNEEELTGPKNDNYPSATLQEDFEGLEDQGLESGLEDGMSVGTEAFEEADFADEE